MTITALILPQLSEWAEGHLLAIFNAYLYSKPEEFESAWGDFFSEHATLMINGRQLTLEVAKEMLLSILKAYGSSKISVAFRNAVQIGKNAENERSAGCVSLVYDLLVDGTVVSTNSLHLFIDQDHSLPHSEVLQDHIRDGFDTRRVFRFDEIVVY